MYGRSGSPTPSTGQGTYDNHILKFILAVIMVTYDIIAFHG